LRIYYLPGGPDNDTPSPLKVCVIGSCRVVNPLDALVSAQEAVCAAWVPAFTHTAGEAVQFLEYCLDRRTIPSELVPFIFDSSHPPEKANFLRNLLADIDVYLLEISSLDSLECDGLFFQLNYFFRNFVQAHGSKLLQWYKTLNARDSDGESIRELTIDGLKDLPVADQLTANHIIRNAVIYKDSAETIRKVLAGCGDLRGKPLGIVSHFCVPGLEGKLMSDRQRLTEAIASAVAPLQAPLFNPTLFFERFEPAVVLDKEGRDIYHYAADFNYTAGKALEKFVYYTFAIGKIEMQKPAQPDAARQPDDLSDPVRLNEVLCEISERRVAALGVDGSGLYQHYHALLTKKMLLSDRERTLTNLIVRFLPSHSSYHLLRAGLGELAFLLAAKGLSLSVYEPNANRRAAIADISEELTARFNIPFESRINLNVNQDLPGQETDELDGLCIAPFLQGNDSAMNDPSNAIWLSRFEALLFDPGYIFRRRNTETEQQTFVDEVIKYGRYNKKVVFPSLNLVYCKR
jgi:hypothetical protein